METTIFVFYAARHPSDVSGGVGVDGPGMIRQSTRKGMLAMSEESDGAPAYPYSTHLDVKFGPLERVDVPALVAACTDRWYNQTLCRVNDAVVRLGVVQGEYHWHKHDADDEFFYVVDGRFWIDLEDGVIELGPGQGVVVPKGVLHRPRAPERTVMLMMETAGIVPTGD